MDFLTSTIIAAACTVGCVVSAAFFMLAYRRRDFRQGFWLKTLTSLLFVAVAVVFAANGSGGSFAALTVCGLVLGLVGDVLLVLRQIYETRREFFFTLGAVSFAAGHVMYVLALSTVGTLHLGIILAVSLAGVAISHWYACRMGTDAGKKKIHAMAYVVIVIVMAATAVCAAVMSASPATVLFAVGGVLFAVSDNILCAYSYGKSPVWRMNRRLHIAYYGAQLAIAWSILFV